MSSSSTGERLTAIEFHHVGQGCRCIDRCSRRFASEFGIGAVQISDETLGIGQLRELPKIN